MLKKIFTSPLKYKQLKIVLKALETAYQNNRLIEDILNSNPTNEDNLHSIKKLNKEISRKLEIIETLIQRATD